MVNIFDNISHGRFEKRYGRFEKCYGRFEKRYGRFEKRPYYVQI